MLCMATFSYSLVLHFNEYHQRKKPPGQMSDMQSTIHARGQHRFAIAVGVGGVPSQTPKPLSGPPFEEHAMGRGSQGTAINHRRWHCSKPEGATCCIFEKHVLQSIPSFHPYRSFHSSLFASLPLSLLPFLPSHRSGGGGGGWLAKVPNTCGPLACAGFESPPPDSLPLRGVTPHDAVTRAQTRTLVGPVHNWNTTSVKLAEILTNTMHLLLWLNPVRRHPADITLLLRC